MRKFLAGLITGVLLLGAVAAQPSAAAERPTSAPSPDRINVEFANEEIAVVLRNVCELLELNLVVPDTLWGKRTSVKLRNVTWRQVFREVLAPAGYTFIEDDNIVRVVELESMERYRYQFQQTSASRLTAIPLANLQRNGLLGWIALTHLVLALGVAADCQRIRLGRSMQSLCALVTMLGGVVAVLAYWLYRRGDRPRSDCARGTPP